MTSLASEFPVPPAGRLWIEGDVESLFDALLEHGFEERSSMVSDGISVPDGLYVERVERGLLVWVPPDPKRAGVDPMVLPRAVSIEVEPDGDRTKLELNHTSAPATFVSTIIAIALSWAAVGVAWVVDSTAVWTVVVVLGAALWGALLYQQRIAAERGRLAWDALQPILDGLATSPPTPMDGDPYR